MLNENIKKLRKAKGLSQEDLAIKLHVVRQTVSKWEQGLSVPDAAMLIALADALGTTVSTLLGDTPDAAALPADDDTDTPTVQQLAAQLETLNAQFAARCEASRRRWRAFFILLAVIAGISLLLSVAAAVFFLSIKLQDSASIGIIGGADGPTAIFVTGDPLRLPGWLITAILVTVSAAGLYRTRKK